MTNKLISFDSSHKYLTLEVQLQLTASQYLMREQLVVVVDCLRELDAKLKALGQECLTSCVTLRDPDTTDSS